MKRNIFLAAAFRGVATLSLLGAASAPTLALAQAPGPGSSAVLAASLASTALRAEKGALAGKLSTADTQATIELALEQAITTSGSDPAVAVAALVAARANMEKAGTLTPAIAAAIASLLAKIQVALKNQDAPGATGGRGSAALGGPPASGLSGGSDYRPGS